LSFLKDGRVTLEWFGKTLCPGCLQSAFCSERK